MTDDLVKRVRRIGIGSELGATTRDRTTAQEAADRIETLEAALKTILADNNKLLRHEIQRICWAALAGEKKDE